MIGQFAVVMPEITLAIIAMVAQVLAVFFKERVKAITSALIVSLMILVVALVYFAPPEQLAFGDSFQVSPVINFIKALVLIFAIMSVVIYSSIRKIAHRKIKTEFIVLLVLSTLGVFLAISARDLVLLFCAIELQSLTGYALAAFNRKDASSSEAGLKYFVLGAMVSCIMLFGISFLYGFAGSIYFADVKHVLNTQFNIPVITGIVMVMAALLFKVSAAPLHIWTPDVYEGAPLAAVSYFAVAQKIGSLVVLINFITLVVADYAKISADLIRIVAVLSIVVGALGAIMQSSLKRLMAYSTILNVGYALIAISLHTDKGLYAAFLYMFIYVTGAIGFFACLAALFGEHSDKAVLADLKGIAEHRKALAGAIAIFMFSMIGLPPLAGFFGKYYIFLNAVKHGQFVLVFVGLAASVVAAFYYLIVIKYMYFIDAEKEMELIQSDRGITAIIAIALSFTLLFFVFGYSYLF